VTAPTLVLIRGNSGSGKTTTAREVRHRYGRGCALIELSHRPLGVRDVDEAADLDPPAVLTFHDLHVRDVEMWGCAWIAGFDEDT
jgi:cytidylate kinase